MNHNITMATAAPTRRRRSMSLGEQGPVTSFAMHYQADTLTLQTQYVEALVVWLLVSLVVAWRRLFVNDVSELWCA